MGLALHRTQSEENCSLKTGEKGFLAQINAPNLHELTDTQINLTQNQLRLELLQNKKGPPFETAPFLFDVLSYFVYLFSSNNLAQHSGCSAAR